MTVDWEAPLSRLADELTAKGKLTSPRWQTAFRAIPRHVFVPEFFQQDNKTGDWDRVVVDHQDALETVYSNVALVTDVDQDGRGVSSSSMPGLMTRMLELLDVRDGHRLLEIGTGTGYNAALLCAALGDQNVYSLDIDYVHTAKERLASLGFRPTLRRGNGIDGMPDHAPFNQIVATVAVPRIPRAWIDQLVDGGAILADIKVNPAAGNLVLLHKRDAIAEGRFDEGQAWFMQMRHPGRPETPAVARDTGTAARGVTTLGAVAWEQPVPWFLACLEVGGGVDVGFQLDDDYRPVVATLVADDGSWAEVEMAPGAHVRAVTQAGPTRLWDAVERGFELWESNDRPGWGRFGLTVSPDLQRIWLDNPDGPTLGHLSSGRRGAAAR